VPRADKIIDLVFPTGGYNVRQAYQKQRPYTSPACVNVRAFDTEEGRERGGQRPGLGRSHAPTIGGGNPIRMLQGCNVVIDDTVTWWQDDFRASPMATPWVAAPDGFPTIDTARHFAVLDDSTLNLGAIFTPSDLDSTLPFHVGVMCVPYLGSHRGVYRIYADLQGVDLSNGFRATITLGASVGAFSWTLSRVVADVATSIATGSGTDSGERAGWFRLELTDQVSGSPTTYVLRLWWNETLLHTSVAQAEFSGSQYFAFAGTPTASASPCQVQTFRIHYNSDNVRRTARQILVASANGAVFQEDRMGFMDEVSVSRTLADDLRVRAADRGENLYIADRSLIELSGTDGVVTAGVLDAASVSDWTTIDAAAGDLLVEVTAATGNLVNGIYGVTTIVAGNVTLTGTTKTGNCTYRIGRGPKIYDPKAKTLSHLTASSGKAPLGSTCVVRWRDRLVWAGPGHAYFMSRQGDPLDYDYGADGEDAQRAVSATLAEAGVPGEPITALMPFTDDLLIFGCENSLWVLRGDPALGGQRDMVSATVGVLTGDAWCYGPNRELYFLGKQGLFRLAADSLTPEPLNDMWGRRLGRDVDSNLYDVMLSFDSRELLINVFMTAHDVRYTDLHATVDARTGALWPLRFGDGTSAFITSAEPTSVCYSNSPIPGEAGVILGCRDGALRYFRDVFENDEGDEIVSSVEIGPLMMGAGREGMLMKMLATLGDRSGSVRFHVRGGHSGEEAFLAEHFASSAMIAGTNRWWTTRLAAGAFIVALSNEEERSWQIENISAQVRGGGMIRPG